MKKILVMWLIIGAFLVGCSSFTEAEPIPVHPLFSADENKYSLLMVGETETRDYNKWREENKILMLRRYMVEVLWKKPMVNTSS